MFTRQHGGTASGSANPADTSPATGRTLPILLVAGPRGYGSGIGRYVEELITRIGPPASLRVVRQRHLPLVRGRPGFLPHLPTGLTEPSRGALVHFTRIMGCAQMLWRPVHPAVATVHDLGPLVCPEDQELWSAADRWVFMLQLRGLRRMNHWIVNSEQTRSHLVQYLHIPRSRVSWVQLGVDCDRFSPSASAAQFVRETAKLVKEPGLIDVLYVGNELPRKGLRYLLQSVSMLKANGVRVRLLKVGGAGGDRFRSITNREIRDLGLKDDVHFLGFVPDAALHHVYTFADIYVTPTLLEGGFTWTAMEAMACGTPVVATTSALIRPAAAGAATIVPPRDPTAIATAVRQLIAEPQLRAQMGVAGRHAVSQFGWNQTVDQLMDVYKRFAPDPKLGPRGRSDVATSAEAAP